MIPRVLPALLALVLAGDPPSSADPFVLVLEGREGRPPEAFWSRWERGLDSVEWAPRPRRDTVDHLAMQEVSHRHIAFLGRPALPEPPARVPAGLDGAAVPVADRLASWVPADAAAVFFGSLREAEDACAELARFLPGALPGLCGEPPGGRREALRRGVDALLLPTIWRANPEVRTGTRQIALVVSDPDVRWAPDIALVCEVDDASLVLAHRRATFSWEERRPVGLRVDGLDAVSDDGSIRSRFALEGGIAVWSTTRSLRDRVLAAGAGRAPSLLRPDGRALALARTAFPASGGGPLLVVPDAFLARVSGTGPRILRAAGLACEARRLLLDAGTLGGREPAEVRRRFLGGCEGEVLPRAGDAGSSCTLHGTAAFPAPLGDLEAAARARAAAAGREAGPVLPVAPMADSETVFALKRLLDRPDPILAGAVPVAARWRDGALEVLVPPGRPGADLVGLLRSWAEGGASADPGGETPRARRERLLARGLPEGRIPGILERLTGLGPGEPAAEARRVAAPPERPGGGVLVLRPGALAWRE